MALITCSECGHEVSDKAAVCIKCGAPLGRPFTSAPRPSKPKASIPWYLSIPIIIAMLWGMSKIGTSDTPQKVAKPPSPERIARQTKRDALESAAVVTLDAVKRTTRNPDRFSVQEVTAMDSASAVCMKVRAENGYGGLNIVSIVVTIDPPPRMETHEDDEPSALWASTCNGQAGRDIMRAVQRRL